MVRYCKICGQKSGRCNHVILDLGVSAEGRDEGKNETKKSGSKD